MHRKALLAAAAILIAFSGAPAVVLEGHFDGRADHTSGTPGVYVVGETYEAFLTLNAVQENPWFPWNPAFEYTAVFSTTVASYDGASNPQTVTWNTGTVTIYEDAATPATFANKATFTDGTAILSGSIFNLAGRRVNNFGQPWAVTGDLVLDSGSEIGSLNPQCSGNMVMNDFINFQLPPGAWPDSDGYEEAYDAKWECPGSVTGQAPRSWGRVKGSYR